MKKFQYTTFPMRKINMNFCIRDSKLRPLFKLKNENIHTIRASRTYFMHMNFRICVTVGGVLHRHNNHGSHLY